MGNRAHLGTVAKRATSSLVRVVRLEIPAHVAADLERKAVRLGVSLESFILARVRYGFIE